MVYVQPTKKPEWNTGGSNRTEPTAGEKIAGWVVDDQPPSSYFNWLQYYSYAWLEWLNERFYKGATEVDLTINALQPDSSGAGGNLALAAGDANTSGAGGDFSVMAGEGLGAEGGDVNIAAGQSDLDGGDVTIDGGENNTSGSGGSAIINGGSSNNGTGGAAILRGGTCNSAGAGGKATVAGGDASGTNQAAGDVDVESGDATGTGGGRVKISAAESGVSGTGIRTPQQYALFSGLTKRIDLARHLTIADASDTTRGVIRLTAKAQPTAPLAGDIYPDSTTNQLGFYNGTRYHNLNPLVYNISDDGIVGDNPSAPASTTVVINETPYGGAVGTTPLRYIIPANTLRIGSVVRVRAMFILTDNGGGASYPSPKLYIGSIGAGPSPYTAPTGVKIFDPDRSVKIWGNCTVEADLCVRGIGGAGAVDLHWRSWFDENGSAVSPVDNGLVINTYTLATNAALDVFAAVLFGTSVNWDITLYQFIVDVI